MYEKKPMTIENTSMEIIDAYLHDVDFTEEQLPVVRRMIHTTGDVDYRHIIDIHAHFIGAATEAVRSQAKVYTDTNMVRAGINKKALEKSGVELLTLISDEDVAEKARERKTTRSIVAIEEAVKRGCTGFIIGNAPTALFRLLELIDEEKANPAFLIAVPVGFVGAAQSKEKVADYDVPYIRTRGTKGGSNVAASIFNAILYGVYPR